MSNGTLARSRPREFQGRIAKRAKCSARFWASMCRASDEVAKGRLVSLEGFSFAFRVKNEEERTVYRYLFSTVGLNKFLR